MRQSNRRLILFEVEETKEYLDLNEEKEDKRVGAQAKGFWIRRQRPGGFKYSFHKAESLSSRH